MKVNRSAASLNLIGEYSMNKQSFLIFIFGICTDQAKQKKNQVSSSQSMYSTCPSTHIPTNPVVLYQSPSEALFHLDANQAF